MKETWKVIDWSNGVYEISDLGRVRRAVDGKHVAAGHVLSISKTPNGYSQTTCYLNHRMRTIHIHREVARAFIPNPDNKEQVNHKNGVKDDNRVSNLEWVTQSENMRHAQKELGWTGRPGVGVLQIASDGTILNRFDSAKAAASAVCRGSDPSNTRSCISVVCSCIGRRTFRKVFHRDFIWVKERDYTAELVQEALRSLKFMKHKAERESYGKNRNKS